MSEPLFDEIIADAQQRALPALTPRAVALPWLPGKVDALVGMRRAGKTWRVFQRMAELVAAGTPREDLLYLNFEDERLGGLQVEDLSRLLEAHYRRSPASRRRQGALFFDEIQVIDGWERFVRRLVDAGDAHLCVTGSSAKLLSTEIATSLRGRSLATEVFPFSFGEALTHLAVPHPARPSAKERSALEHATGEYLKRGGFPEVQQLDEAMRVCVLQSYLDVAILRDIVERHAVSNVAALRKFVRQLMNTPAGLFSVHKLYDDLKSQGQAVSKDSLHAWLEHVEDAYVFFQVPLHTSSERVRQVNPRKVYAVDPGLVTACARRGSADTGQLLETAVFLELRRRTKDVAYARSRGGFEVDFVTDEVLVQSCASLGDAATKERELRAVDEVMEELGRREATIVTLHETGEFKRGRRTVHAVPFWRWALAAGL